jgi:ubiquinone/menaquinone biosynthesis C-methylase UbiE
VKFFKSSNLEPLSVTMTGVKMGNRLLIAGGSDGLLVAQLAAKPGLTGRTLLVDEDPDVAGKAALTAEADGSLVEKQVGPWERIDAENESFDVAVVRDVLDRLEPYRRASFLGEVLRVLRPGGRCVVIESMGRSGLGALLDRRRQNAEYVSSGGAISALSMAGFRAARQLAERDGLRFVEGGRG